MRRAVWIVCLSLFLLAGCQEKKDTAPPPAEAAKTTKTTKAKSVEPAAPTAPADAKSAPEALLLGLWSEQDSHFRTYWVTDKGITPLGRGVAFQQGGAWWKLDRRRDVYKSRVGENVYQTLYAGPKGTPPPPATATDLEYLSGCEGWKGQSVLFVGDNVIGISGGEYGDCEDTAHPTSYGYLVTQRPAQLGHEARRVSVETVLGKKAWEILEKAGQKTIDENEYGDCNTPPSPTEWAIDRHEGKWVLKGWLGYESEACRSQQMEFIVPFDVPQKISGAQDLPGGWQKFKKANPDALDAIASPSGRIVLAIHNKEMLLQVDGTEVARRKVPGKSSMVMTRWTRDKAEIANWKRQARDVLK